MFLNLMVFSLSCFLLLKSAGLFIRGAVGISGALGLPKIFIGVTIVSLVTTVPELVVSLVSGFMGESGLAVGNALGSAICNIGLVLSIGMIIRGIKVQKEDLKYRIPSLLGSMLIAYIFIIDGVIDRKEAIFMLAIMALFIAHNYTLVLRGKNNNTAKAEADKSKPVLLKSAFLFLSGGVFTLALARFGLLPSAVKIADIFGFSRGLIGLTLVALGTSLPELFTAIISSHKRHGEIALGNVIGASIMDLLLLFGILGLIGPVEIDRQTIVFNMPFALLLAAAVFVLSFGRSGLSRKKGVFLLVIYCGYIAALYAFVYK